jgi:hypothetical protein
MQTQTIKQKPAGARLHGNRVGYFGVTHREYAALARFSNAAKKLGLETTGISKGPFGVGCLLKMSSGKADYEVLLNGAGHLLVGRIENGQRVKLGEGGTNTEAQWTMLLRTGANKGNHRRAKTEASRG